MTAIAVLFSTGAFEHYFIMQTWGMTDAVVRDILAGEVPDELGIVWKYRGMQISWWVGILLLWAAMVLTLVTGGDYFRKSLPHLKG
jgi:CDP-diacylglycerol--glycerol-3-phosphate 3-phosphatidyltransferase